MDATDLGDQVRHYVERLRGGDEDAYFSLLELDAAAVPLLRQTLTVESDPQVRRNLADVIGEHRLASSVPFLAGLLFDQDWLVRQAAIDGLWTLGSAEALQVLASALARCRAGSQEDVRFADYLAEALELIAELPRT
jgi:HEAT repeat protein